MSHLISPYLVSLSQPFPVEVVLVTGDHGPGEMIANKEEKQTLNQTFVTNNMLLQHASLHTRLNDTRLP